MVNKKVVKGGIIGGFVGGISVAIWFSPVGLFILLFLAGVVFGLSTGVYFVASQYLADTKMAAWIQLLLWIIGVSLAYVAAVVIAYLPPSPTLCATEICDPSPTGLVIAGVFGAFIVGLLYVLLIRKITPKYFVLAIIAGGVSALIPTPFLYFAWQSSVLAILYAGSSDKKGSAISFNGIKNLRLQAEKGSIRTVSKRK